MATKPAVTVRPITAADEPRWRELFAAYREFYKLEPSDAVLDRVWSWLLDPAHPTSGLVASVDGTIQGIAHHRFFFSPYVGTKNVFLDDLFTDPAARGQGVGRALIGALTDLAGAEACDIVQWETADDNHTAQTLYDSLASRTTWVTYEAQATRP
ncbi:GNAT family N-acetyltransferase [Leucobacter sp. cx-328]|uniref:GNAT family N-acetyltransferase n=1 Tax=unclassified Leucobacter TaxID=2621730 RepID=UPI00165D314F|nr:MULTISPECIES: GNAT family N-acetyltransferase [unclassified Leucobacter]MBC9944133.1 GNAT family N-acetyltransferase [Leucobacter sp. cx-328]